MEVLQTGLGSGGGGGHRGGPSCLHPFQPLTVAPGPLTLATSGSSAPAKVIGSLERAGGTLFSLALHPRKSWGFPLPPTWFLFCNLSYLSR